MSGGDEGPAFRIKVLGEDGVGKKSYIHRCCTGQWVPNTRDAGVNGSFLVKAMPIAFASGHALPVHVFDVSPTSGDRSMTITSLRSFHGIVVCYDLTSFSSFASVGNLVRMVRNSTSKGRRTALPLVIVGLKSDRAADVAVTPEQMSQAAVEFDVAHYAVSALSGDGVDESFAKICELVFEDNRPALLQHFAATAKPPMEAKKKSLTSLVRNLSSKRPVATPPAAAATTASGGQNTSSGALQTEDPRDYSAKEIAALLARLQAVASANDEAGRSPAARSSSSGQTDKPPLSFSLSPESVPSSVALPANPSDLSYFLDADDKDAQFGGEALHSLASGNLDTYIDQDDISDGGKYSLSSSTSEQEQPPVQQQEKPQEKPTLFDSASVSSMYNAADTYGESDALSTVIALQKQADLCDDTPKLTPSRESLEAPRQHHHHSHKERKHRRSSKKDSKSSSGSKHKSSRRRDKPSNSSSSAAPVVAAAPAVAPAATSASGTAIVRPTSARGIPPAVYCDLNNRHQKISRYLSRRLAAGALDTTDKDFQAANVDLIDLKLDFLSTVKTYGRVIICERYLPVEAKTIKPRAVGGAAGGEKFIVNNVLFKFAVDSHGIYGSEYAAMKVAGHELKGLGHYVQCGVSDLCFPMICLLDYLGFRVTAMTLLPLAADSLRYGSPDGGRTVMYDARFVEYMRAAAAKLNLQPHLCRDADPVLMYSACDIEGHLGSDGRAYLLDFSRSMPPTAPDSAVPAGHLFRLFRSEFVAAYPKPLCPDAFSGFVRSDPARGDYNEEIRAATNHLLHRVVPVAAWKILLSIREAFALGDIRLFSLSYQFHRHGINMRYLGKVIEALVERGETGPAVAYVFLEVVARVVKNGLRRRLRKQLAALRIPLEAPYSRIIVHYLNQVFAESPRCETYLRNSPESAWVGIASWAERAFLLDANVVAKLLPPRQQQQQSVIPLDCHRQLLSLNFGSDEQPLTARYLLYHRIAELTGLSFSSGCVARLNSSSFSKFAPFRHQDFEEHGIRIKCLPPLSTCHAVNVLAQARLGQYDAEAARDSLDQARKALAVASSATPLAPELLFQMAMVIVTEKDYCSQGDRLRASEPDAIAIDQLFQTAISQWSRMSASHPALAEANFYYARFLASVERWRRAEDYFVRALEIDPFIPLFWEGYIRFLDSLPTAAAASSSTATFLDIAKSRLATLHNGNYRRRTPTYHSILT